MLEIALLRDLVIVLGAAVVVVAILRRLGIPSIAGFILTGVLTGPTILRLVKNTHQVETAEIGTILRKSDPLNSGNHDPFRLRARRA
jgi:Kef-type K+ transport system membrane component KefB